MLFQVTAIILLLVFYGCYFGKMFLQKRQGIQTDQIGKGKTGTAKVIETLMKITTILVPLVEVICIVFNQTMLPFGARIKGAFIALNGAKPNPVYFFKKVFAVVVNFTRK